MWSLVNTTPFPAHVAAFRDHTGASFWAVWVKATFALRDARPALFLAEQTPLWKEPQYENANPADRMIADSDLAQHKPAIDFVLLGHATPNNDGTARAISVALGDWRKTLHLYPPRRTNWRGALVADKEIKPVPVPLDARSGFGGPTYEANPLGQGAEKGTGPAFLAYPDDKKCLRPAYFGPIPPTWPERRDLGGTYDAQWQSSRAPLLPTNFSPVFWQSAPEDQRLPRHIGTDLAVEITGLEAELLRYPLPLLSLLTSTRIAGKWHPKVPDLQTIFIDLDKRKVNLTYLASWPIPAASQDVMIDATKVQLENFEGFRVSSEDASMFAQQSLKSESV